MYIASCFARDQSQFDNTYQPGPADVSNHRGDYPDSQPTYGSHQQPPSHDNYAPYAPATNGDGGLVEQFSQQLHMETERYSERGDSMRYNAAGAYGDGAQPPPHSYEPPLNDSFSAQGSGYYGNPPPQQQSHDPYGNQQDLGYAQGPYGDNRSQSPPSERIGKQGLFCLVNAVLWCFNVL